MPEEKTLNDDLFNKGSSANLPRLHTCENKVPFWDKSKFFASHMLLNGGSNPGLKININNIYCL